MPRCFRLPITFLLLAFVANAFAQDYAIKLWRPKKAGMKFQVTGRATERDEQVVIVSGKTNRTENASDLDFAAEAEVIEVDSNGQVTKASFNLTNCSKSSQKGREQLFPKGTVINWHSTNALPCRMAVRQIIRIHTFLLTGRPRTGIESRVCGWKRAPDVRRDAEPSDRTVALPCRL